MPEMDGFEFLRRFRATAAGRRTPIIVWTIKDLTPAERVQLLGSVQAVVEKGQGTSALLDEVRAHVPAPAGPAEERHA